MDLADAVMFLKSGRDIVVDDTGHARYPYVDRQCWPNIQHLPHRRFTGAYKLEVQATWCCKHDGSPPPAHVHLTLPFFIVVIFAHVEGKYLEENLFRSDSIRTLAMLQQSAVRARLCKRRYSTSILYG
jgi:hypothetical protein